MRAAARRIRRPARERGQVLVETVVSLLAILLVCAFVVDMGIIQAERVHQLQTIRQAEAELQLPASALGVKSSMKPGSYVTRELVERLRAGGYNGKITAYYYEPSASELGLSNAQFESCRLFVYGAYTESEIPTVFGITAGTESMFSRTGNWQDTVILNAGGKIYRPISSGAGYYSNPSNSSNGYMVVEAGAAYDSGTWHSVGSIDENQMPGVTAAIGNAKKAAGLS